MRLCSDSCTHSVTLLNNVQLSCVFVSLVSTILSYFTLKLISGNSKHVLYLIYDFATLHYEVSTGSFPVSSSSVCMDSMAKYLLMTTT